MPPRHFVSGIRADQLAAKGPVRPGHCLTAFALHPVAHGLDWLGDMLHGSVPAPWRIRIFVDPPNGDETKLDQPFEADERRCDHLPVRRHVLVRRIAAKADVNQCPGERDIVREAVDEQLYLALAQHLRGSTTHARRLPAASGPRLSDRQHRTTGREIGRYGAVFHPRSAHEDYPSTAPVGAR